jgi:soluble lytic murein transglycosylase-like protein
MTIFLRAIQLGKEVSLPGLVAFPVDKVFDSLITQESRGRAGAVGPMTQYGQALGMAQTLPGTARQMAGRLGLPYSEAQLRGKDAASGDYQRKIGRAYFDEALGKTGNARDALHYYHGGPNRKIWGPKTRAYANEVLARVN